MCREYVDGGGEDELGNVVHAACNRRSGNQNGRAGDVARFQVGVSLQCIGRAISGRSGGDKHAVLQDREQRAGAQFQAATFTVSRRQRRVQSSERETERFMPKRRQAAGSTSMPALHQFARLNSTACCCRRPVVNRRYSSCAA